jgi:hypothetical protein
MEGITIVCSYYDQPEGAERWWDCLRGYSDEAREFAKFVFVDDGSPNHPMEIPDDILRDFQVRLFRVKEDILWNEMGARNLAMKHIDGWALLMDNDYTMAGDQVEILPGLDARPNYTYVPRARPFGGKRHIHHPPNLFIIRGDVFWRAGGYCEDYAGGYGLSDTELLRVLENQKVIRRKLQKIWIDHYKADLYPRASVQWLDRSMGRNDKIFKSRLNAMNQHGVKRVVAQNKHLNFEWERVH